MRDVPWLSARLGDKGDKLHREIDNFNAVFENAKACNGTTRGQVAFMNRDLADELVGLVQSSFPEGSLITALAPDLPSGVLRDNLQPACWGYAAKAILYGVERALLPTIRIAAVGSRELAVSRLSQVGAHVRAKSCMESQPFNTQACVNWLQEAPTGDYADCLKAGYDIQWATVGAGQMLYTPAAAITIERVANNSDTVGFRVPALCPVDSVALADLKAGILGLQVNPVTSQAIDYLSHLDPIVAANRCAASAAEQGDASPSESKAAAPPSSSEAAAQGDSVPSPSERSSEALQRAAE